MRIKVLQDHIDKGKPGQASGCPIALAVAEAFGGARVEVAQNDLTIGQVYLQRLPRAVNTFIHTFDTHLPVKPFTFTLKF